MARDTPVNRQMRARIAQLAARMMAEDGIDDFGLAKRKAARQAGASGTRNLPDNAEIETALREHLALYQADERPARLAGLRQEALELMQLLEPFEPHLVGAVLSGSVGKYAGVDLHLFTDDAKALEMFLLNRGLDFRPRESRYWIAGEARTTPVYELDGDRATATLTVFETRDLRHPIRPSQSGNPVERVRRGWLEERVGVSGAP